MSYQQKIAKHRLTQSLVAWIDDNNLLIQVAYHDTNCAHPSLWGMLKIWYQVVIQRNELLIDHYPHLADHLEVNIVGTHPKSQAYSHKLKGSVHYQEF